MTNQISLFPINMNVDLNDDGLQLNVNGGAAWNLQFTPNGLVDLGPIGRPGTHRQISGLLTHHRLRRPNFQVRAVGRP